MARIVRHLHKQARFSRGLAADWTSENPVLYLGEPGLETDTGRFKMGNGTTAWASLSYFGGGGDAEDITVDSTDLTGTGTDLQTVLEELDDAVSGAGAPTTADYLVGTTNGGLSAEIVVGTSPGGELGGTWASPTVDATHSGSTHAATQAAAESTASSAAATHAAASDPHTGYRLESADHSHATTGAQAGNIAGTAVTVDSTNLDGTATNVQAVFEELETQVQTAASTHAGAADPHTGYVLESLFDAAGDLITASADNTPAKLSKGSALQVLRVNAGATALEYADPAAGSAWTQVINKDGTTFTGFTSTSGTWASDATQIKQTDTAAAFHRAYYATKVQVANFIFEAEVQIRDTGNNHITGIIMGFDGTLAGGMAVRLDEGLNEFLFEADGTASHLSVAATIAEDTWYKIRLVGGPNGISGYLDGTLMGTVRYYTTSALKDATYVGMYSYQTESWFRNIKGWELTLPA